VDDYDLDDPQADHTARGVELDEHGDMQAALRSFEAAARFSPEDGASFNNLAIAHQSIGDFEHAVYAILHSLWIDPTDALALGTMVELHYSLLPSRVGVEVEQHIVYCTLHTIHTYTAHTIHTYTTHHTHYTHYTTMLLYTTPLLHRPFWSESC
jgi:tetratricopeptide (TPR) repeat protein